VSVASPEHLLVMKVLAARRRDVADIRFLIQHLNLDSAEKCFRSVPRSFPTSPYPNGAQLVPEDALRTGEYPGFRE
jgi:hypothetical protein